MTQASALARQTHGAFSFGFCFRNGILSNTHFYFPPGGCTCRPATVIQPHSDLFLVRKLFPHSRYFDHSKVEANFAIRYFLSFKVFVLSENSGMIPANSGCRISSKNKRSCFPRLQTRCAIRHGNVGELLEFWFLHRFNSSAWAPHLGVAEARRLAVARMMNSSIGTGRLRAIVKQVGEG